MDFLNICLVILHDINIIKTVITYKTTKKLYFSNYLTKNNN